jgi:hypothetical protein
MPDPSSAATRRCTAHKRNGEQCRRTPINGADVCSSHGGRAPQVRRNALVRAEVQAWRLEDQTDDPGEVLLRLVTQSARRCALYGALLEKAYDAAERLHAVEAELLIKPEGDEDDWEPPRLQQARMDLDQVFSAGGVSALIGKTYGAAGKEGHIFATGEAIRGLALLEAQERDRCANFAAKAITAGLAERQVKLAERMGASVLLLLETFARLAGLDWKSAAVVAMADAALLELEGSAA